MKARATILALFIASCGGASTHPEEPPGDRVDTHTDTDAPPEAGGTAHSVPRIDDAATWARLASRPRNHHIARTEVVKFVIDVRGPTPAYHFLESNLFESHYDFVHQLLEPRAYRDGMDFYRRVYRVEDRPYVVGSIVRYEDADAWTFELISGDNLSGERILWLFEALRDHTFFGEALRFRPTSDVHVEHIASVADRLPITNDDALYGAMRYQPVQLGVAFGTLRVVRGAVQRGTLSPHDVLVTDEVPDDLPLVAALITSRFQAPLAHVAVLSGNRGTPDMALRGAVDAAELTALEGQLVRLDVGAQEWTIRAATREEAEASWAGVERPTFTPPRNLRARALVDQCSLGFDDVPSAGAKASNMGVLCRLAEQGVSVPPGFVIPFAHYVEHLTRHGLDPRIRAFLEGSDRRGDPTAALEALRAAIIAAPVAPALLGQVRDRIRALSPGGRVILRSSTNAEDLPGFNGAGLYSSEMIDADASDEEIAGVLRRIWASVWNLGAFQEREHYRIDHARVAMAVLVQRAIVNAVGNGVAITRNPYDPIRPGVLINIQAHGASVTGAVGDQIPEQWLVMTYLPAREPELIARSSLSPDTPILRREEVLELTRQLEVIHGVFEPRLDPEWANAVDVEMLLTGGDRRFMLVQARPYRVAYQGREAVRP
ncbi:MAG: hypothetical protein H6719_21815 [Sandaracinaceae bacterium]|nr:hypothetical protein [Sandaracinaceae bacterium]